MEMLALPDDGRIELSIVSTLYRSAAYIEEFYHRMTGSARHVTNSYEIIFVDDGSPDNSLEIAVSLSRKDAAVSVVELSRNFGHHAAILAGLTHARGACVFMIDVDLEEQPEWLEQFWQAYQTKQYDVIAGVQARRGGQWFRRFSGQLFYRLFNLMSDQQILVNQMTARLMSRAYVDALLRLRDKNLFLAGNLAWVGFRQQPLRLERKVRASQSSYTLVRRLGLFINAITSFTSYPLHIVFFVGLVISMAALLGALSVVVNKLLHPEAVLLGFASLIVSIWLLGGLTILFVGVVGIYLSRVFVEVKPRPQFIVRQLHRQGGEVITRRVQPESATEALD
jgi:putative glycosyltransferase